MPKKLKVSNVDRSFCMTVRELRGILTQYAEDVPVILKCGGKNYRFTSFECVAGKPVLIGKRGIRD